MGKDFGPISMSDLAAKGRALESSVRAIETVILHASPSLAKKTFCISSNRVVTVDGVRHEIDVHVEVAIAPGYDAVFLFECKNWEAKVGKNEIIVFSEKISALRAQKGFFVAKSFTADALAQAKKDARMELLVAAEIDSVPLPFDFFCVSPQIVTTEVSFARTAGSDDGGNGRVAIDIESAISLSEFASVRAYAAAWAADVVNGDVSLFKAHEVPDGSTHAKWLPRESTTILRSTFAVLRARERGSRWPTAYAWCVPPWSPTIRLRRGGEPFRLPRCDWALLMSRSASLL